MNSKLNWMAPAAALLFTACGGGGSAADEYTADAAANPCAAGMAENPCAAAMAANPCAAGGMDASLPIAAIRQDGRILNAHGNTPEQLVAMGAGLWTDPGLSGTGATSCSTCHTGDGTAMMNATFDQPYPHAVAMAKEKAGLDKVNAAEMVQLCMAIPMNAEPLDYGSVELAALTAFVTELHANSRGSTALDGASEMNPCAAGTNPCAAGMNPCAAAENPCGGR
jgi:hypothetical protein